ncbi:hypothetical protein [Lysobacter sp. Root690]|uniref:hypothetical protein n=1 Tax=Lysobacter sp. Root690 TaxID=1736588 RepID=UPI0006F5C8C1|nr:hypothetical protein [Lysobacter sp. Root690]KRB08117.1 hypothetical protein ASD86_10035 [Lysobacter sp. Root690]
MTIVRRVRTICLSTALLVAAAGCGPDPAPAEPVASLPTQAVTQLVADLRRNDLAGYARHALPPELHARLETAWREGRTTWPLTELPLHDRFPTFIAALAAQNAERDLVASFRRQFAGADGELHSAARTLGVFAIQYVRSEAVYSDTERDHHAQLIGAISQWAQTTSLGDSAKGRAAIPQLVSAARATGLAAPDAFAHNGMDRSLRRLGPFVERFKQVLGGYGLDLDAALDSVDATLAEQTGDTARVRIRYQLAGEPVDAYVLVERRQQRWYLSDVLRHAQAEIEAPPRAASAAGQQAAWARAVANRKPAPARPAAGKVEAARPAATLPEAGKAEAGAAEAGKAEANAAEPAAKAGAAQTGAGKTSPVPTPAAAQPAAKPSATAAPPATAPKPAAPAAAAGPTATAPPKPR